jgi:dTDP-4-dehydrorhamnose reductase
MDRKMLATGAGGMVGAYLPPGVIRTDVPDLDVTDRAAVDAAIEENRPDVVLHLAAETNVDRAEQQPDRAYLINAIGTQNVALACARHDIELVYVSSAQVFDGEKHDPYHEWDDVGPRTVYGRSKLAGEEFVRRLVPRHFVVRAGWMIGGGPHGEKKFIAKMLEHAERQGKIVAVNDKYGSPTRAQDLVTAVGALLDSGRYGTVHLVNPGAVTRLDIARVVREVLDLPYEIEAVDSTRFPLPAPRGRSEVMDNLVLRLTGLDGLMPPWEEAVTEYLRAEWVPALQSTT